jgi:hypothetical protein
MKGKIAGWLRIFVLLSVCAPTFLFPDSPDLASHNPLLRRFFWRQAVRAISVYDSRGRRRIIGSRASLPQRVDGLVNNFLKKTKEQLIELREDFEQVKEMRIRILDSPPGSMQRKESFGRWKQPLEELADQANDLRKDLSRPFAALDSKEKFNYRIKPGSEDQAFAREIGFLEEQVAKAEQQINDCLFTPTHTVSLEDLRGENMLINLYRIQKMSQLLEKSL